MLPIPTPDQVRALTTDPGVQRSAAGLVGPRHWSALGRSDRALFGACQGSGKDPYAVAVDLSGPVFRCSCPSRKFPCKHGLALALLAATDPGALPMAAEPADVTTWLDGRDARARVAAEKATAEAPAVADAEAAEKRADARERKVAAGLDELDRWIGDIVRRGLAATRSEGYAFWDAEAARLVDAQAGSLARSVRNLGSVITEGADWPDRVLRRLARLHLVAKAYERIEELPPGLAADVRSAIGWTIREDDLPPTDAVEDEWLVLGRTVDASDDLSTARTWLQGRRTGRMALHLAFGARGAAPRSVGLPGMVLGATCTFYPSATPLRAAIRSSAVVGSVAEIPSEPTLEAATARFAGRMAANPFLDAWPVVMGNVRVAAVDGTWSLVDGAGSVVPAGSAASAVQLLALSAGRPCTVFGEWSAWGVRLLSAMADGRLAELSPPLLEADEVAPFQPPADDAWGLLVSAALLGTERSELPPDLPIPPDGLLPEARLLAAASVEATRRRAGARPIQRAVATPPPAPADTRPLPPAPAVWQLLGLLRSGSDGASLLPEWIALATHAVVRAPDEALPALIAAGTRSPELGLAVAKLAGPRAGWLADQLPEAMRGLRRPTSMTAELATRLLETRPGIAVVRGLLADLRTSDRAGYRDAVEGWWPRLSRDERQEAITALRTGLSQEDASWLEARAAERDTTIAARATELLAMLPAAAVAAERRDLARRALRMEGRFRPSLVVEPAPGWLDAVALVPPSTWLEHLHADASTIASKAAATDQPADLVAALAAATLLHGDADFAEALLMSNAGDFLKDEAPELLGLVPADRQGRIVKHRLPRLDAPQAVTFLAGMPAWTDDTSRAVVGWLEQAVKEPMWNWKVMPLLRLAALRMSPPWADPLEALFNPASSPAGAEYAAGPVATLRLRQELHDSFRKQPSATEGTR